MGYEGKPTFSYSCLCLHHLYWICYPRDELNKTELRILPYLVNCNVAYITQLITYLAFKTIIIILAITITIIIITRTQETLPLRIHGRAIRYTGHKSYPHLPGVSVTESVHALFVFVCVLSRHGLKMHGWTVLTALLWLHQGVLLKPATTTQF